MPDPRRGGGAAGSGLEGQSCAAHIRYALQQLPVGLDSPMTKVPNTYLCRLFVLDDVHFEGHPAVLEHLASAYLVFTANLHGDLDTWLNGLWSNIEKEIARYCGTAWRLTA